MKKHQSIRFLSFSVLLVTMLYSMGANATDYKIRLTSIATNFAGSCEEFFNINTVNAYTINNINIRVGGAPSIDDPGRWQIFSPVDSGMSSTIFGFNVTTATRKYYEYNTGYHNGALATGQWHLLFDEPVGGCAQFSALLTYDATP